MKCNIHLGVQDIIAAPLDEEEKTPDSGVAQGMSMDVEGVSVPPQHHRGGNQASSVSGAQAGVVSLDFRMGILPQGVEVVGGEPIFMTQPDGSTVLRLAPQSYLRVITIYYINILA